MPFRFLNGEAGDLLIDFDFNFYIPSVVLFEELPLSWIMVGKISRSTMISLSRLAGSTKIPDEVFTFFKFLFTKTKNGSDSFKR